MVEDMDLGVVAGKQAAHTGPALREMLHQRLAYGMYCHC